MALKLLADENFALDVVMALRQAGYDVVSIQETSPGLDDENVLKQAVAEDRVLVTFDKDFGELAFRQGLPATCGVILFRITTPSSQEAAQKIVAAIGERSDWPGHFSVVDDQRVRMRPLPA